MTTIRGLFRLLKFIVVLSFYVSRLALTSLFRGWSLDLGLRHRQQCVRALMNALNIRLETRGKTDYEGNFLYISNHRCYLDPIAELTRIRALPVAKAEVAKLPIVGYGARISGIHFVERSSLKSRKDTRLGMAKTIAEGKSILIYPEGTTVKAVTSGAYKPGTFNMAAQNNISIIPIAIEYGDPDDAWVGPEGMPTHFLRQFGQKNKKIRVHYGDPVWHEDANELLRLVKEWLDAQLMSIRREWNLPLEVTPSQGVNS